jgi:hypothetical protein
MRKLLLAGAAATTAAAALAGPASSSSPPVSSRSDGADARVTVTPSVATLGQPVTIAVTGVKSATLSVRLAGGRSAWTPLRPLGGGWRGVLPSPSLRGIYPVQLRTADGGVVLPAGHPFVRVYRPHMRVEPSFTSPDGAVVYWVASRHGALTAYKSWPLSPSDHRDPRLHRLFVVAYKLPGRPQLGAFVTAVREGYAGRWRLLEATVKPPLPAVG